MHTEILCYGAKQVAQAVRFFPFFAQAVVTATTQPLSFVSTVVTCIFCVCLLCLSFVSVFVPTVVTCIFCVCLLSLCLQWSLASFVSVFCVYSGHLRLLCLYLCLQWSLAPFVSVFVSTVVTYVFCVYSGHCHYTAFVLFVYPGGMSCSSLLAAFH